jgi:hypothetical protein
MRSGVFVTPSAPPTVRYPRQLWDDPGICETSTVELVGDEPSAPGQQRIRLRDSRQFFQGFPSKPAGDLSQRSFFGIG